MRKLITILFVSLVFTTLSAQPDKNSVLLTINNAPVTVDEFERIYTKNNQDASFDKASLEEYMELFVNFKLKVTEAEARGLDTLKSFKGELKGYRYQLEKPYLTDPNIDSVLIQEAYERMGYMIKASHILISCEKNALPSDTLAAYKKIEDIRNQIVNKKGNFEKLAKLHSVDEYSAVKGGLLGYFSAFSMVYEFETAAYNTEVGEVSEIIRTNFGYHIVKVLDKKINPGQISVAHIMRSAKRNKSQEKIKEEGVIIQQIYDSIMAGASFEDMVKRHTDDKGSIKNNGALKPFEYGRMVPEFEKAAFALKNVGDISKPVQTAFGWHIIKFLGIKEIGTLEDNREYIKGRISKDIRSNKGQRNLIANLKKEYNFTENRAALESFYDILDTTLYSTGWDKEKAAGLNDVIFTIADTIKYTQADFAEYLSSEKRRKSNTSIRVVVDKFYDQIVDKKIFDYEKSRLEEKYPEFKHLLQEYHDGILLFNLSDELVWSKAIKDTVGLETFYNNNKQNYLWAERVEATTYTFNKNDYLDALTSMAIKVGKKSKDPQKALSKFISKYAEKDSSFTINVSKAKFIKGANVLIDSLGWEPGIKMVVEKTENEFELVYVNQKVDPEPKLLNEARGHITADYQTYLEKEWVKELHEKYAIEINQEVFEKLIK